MKHPIMIALLAAAMTLATPLAQATVDVEAPYGWQIMTQAERTAFMNKLHSMKSDSERTVFIEEHRQQMIERAKQRGVRLPGMSRPKGHSHR
jgi:hypothetical protein